MTNNPQPFSSKPNNELWNTVKPDQPAKNLADGTVA